MKVLFLFESILPSEYHSQTSSPGELRVIAAISPVERVVALGRTGTSFYDVVETHPIKTEFEKRIHLQHYTWPNNIYAYYFCWIGLLWHGYEILKKEKFDIIHAESPHISGIAAIILGKWFKTKVIVEYRVSYDSLLLKRFGKFFGSSMSQIFWLVAGFVLCHADFVMANSATYEKYLIEKLKLGTIGHYNPGVQIPLNFVKKTHKNIVVGFIGRLYEDKGPIYFLYLIDYGKAWFKKNNIRFLLAGDGPEKKSLQDYIKAHKLDDLVTMLGTYDKWEFFKKIDIHINTTIVNAALEMNIAEASSVGVPTLAFGEDGNPETVFDGQNGSIIEIGKISKMATSLKSLIMDVHKRLLFSKNAIKYSQKYEFEIQEKSLGLVYKRIL